MKADVTSPLKILRMREETGPVDILVNNAGIPTSGFELKKFVDTSPEDWEGDDAPQPRRGAARHARVRRRDGRRRVGARRHVVSDAGRKGERMQAIYGAAKAGAMGFMRGLAAEVGAHGVTANCVSLGTMKTGAFAEALEHEPRARAAARPGTTRCRGSASPASPPPLVALLCSDAASWITGQVYPVDGGYVSAL